MRGSGASERSSHGAGRGFIKPLAHSCGSFRPGRVSCRTMSDEVSAAIRSLRAYRDRHVELGKLMYESGPLFPLDLLATAAMNRSLNLTMAFCTLIEARNFLTAAPLIRLQLDSCPRLSAAWLVDDPHAFADKVLYGERVDKMKDSDGHLTAMIKTVEPLYGSRSARRTHGRLDR